ncbi:MAG: hypothetical protein IPK89_14215 [Sphingomonadales bacterium]|nr:hypothetical protein [Sphingomonadales bacterium]MBP7137053.1 hypothetical protein [Sphingomonadaceae bacterium]MBK6719314.1 hypothetical protein [Sphingomonadales bacterium]MBK8273959.1 hypothetical protein [Sphingomonadales bacterium]MBK8860830.1 hypothetical protein [Sphingomonadales bacterium]
MSDHAPILEIRREAADLLQKLDEHDMIEAAALMASTIDMIDASIRRLTTGEPTFGE